MKLRLWNLLPHDYAPFFRILHIIVAFLILSQIINSNLTETEAIGEHSLEGVITWMHITPSVRIVVTPIENTNDKMGTDRETNFTRT
ncbi:hypothetical protein WP3W18E02_P20440 (plasmid) [Klebsiella sp. WP3-W18-ESBL-02]|nr:hypothetical protein WP3W18E02_P20440 [Klebsiella sp. WP3-W18-ESBL-02]